MRCESENKKRTSNCFGIFECMKSPQTGKAGFFFSSCFSLHEQHRSQKFSKIKKKKKNSTSEKVSVLDNNYFLLSEKSSTFPVECSSSLEREAKPPFPSTSALQQEKCYFSHVTRTRFFRQAMQTKYRGVRVTREIIRWADHRCAGTSHWPHR